MRAIETCDSNSVVIAEKDEVENDEEVSHSRGRPKVVRIDRRAWHIDPERSRFRRETRVDIGDVLERYLETERRANIISLDIIMVKGQRLSGLSKKGDNYGRGEALEGVEHGDEHMGGQIGGDVCASP